MVDYVMKAEQPFAKPEVDENTVGEELTAKQEAFCQFYTQISSLFGNATLAYAEAYGYDFEKYSDEKPVLAQNAKGEATEWGDSDRKLAYDACSSAGSRLLRNVKIDKRVRVLLNDMMTNEVIDARLVEIIMKGEDKDSIQAIKEFNKLKQRITEKTDITSGGKSIAGFNFVRADEPATAYADSRTPEEREADSKIEVVTTSTADLLPEPVIVRNEQNNSNNSTNS